MTEWKLRAKGGTLRRFVSPKIHLGEEVGLPADHPAVIEGRTLFPGTVVAPLESPGLFVSGANNSKLGGRVMKGPLKGMPIFHLTLEERKTCPRTCAVWHECYGNGMHLARRHDAFDPYFLPLFRAQLKALAANHPRGVLIRVHTLGDFHTVEYVDEWRAALDRHPNVYVFGYTARDPLTDPIGDAVLSLSMERWDRFAIRFSGDGIRSRGSTTFTAVPPANPALIMCPAQTVEGEEEKTDACATCGICWSESAKDKCIGFLIHGRRRGKSYNTHRVGKPRQRRGSDAQDRLWKTMLAAADSRGVVERTLAELTKDAGVSNAHTTLTKLLRRGLVRVLRKGSRGWTPAFQVFAEPQEVPPAPPLLPAPARKAKPVRIGDSNIRRGIRSNIPDAVAPRDEPPARTGGLELSPSSHRGWRPNPYNSKGKVVRPWLIGTADQFEIGTAEQRVASVDEAEKARIAAAYGVKFKG